METCLTQELYFQNYQKVKKAVFFCHFAFITFTSDEANAHIAYRRITHSRSWYIIQHQREKSCWKSKVCFSRYIYQSQYEFQILLCLWKSKQHSLSFPRNRYLILKYFYSTKKIDTSAEWMNKNFVLCLTICVPKYFAVIQSGGRHFWFQCQRRTHPCRNQLSWTGHCIGTYLQHWQPKGWLLQMERLMELD